jgi:uncharacterized protein
LNFNLAAGGLAVTNKSWIELHTASDDFVTMSWELIKKPERTTPMQTKLFSPILLSMLLLSTTLLTPASAQPSELDSVIALSGTGVVMMEVNMAHVHGAVVTNAVTVSEAQAANAKIFNSMVAVLKEKFELGSKEVRSTGYSVSPTYRYPQGSEPILTGYSVRHGFSIRVNKLDTLGQIVDALGAVGTNLFESIAFSNSDRKKYELEALALAMEDAQAKANVIARTTARTIKEVSKVTYEPVRVPEAVMGREAVLEQGGTSFVPGELEVVATVGVEYSF